VADNIYLHAKSDYDSLRGIICNDQLIGNLWTSFLRLLSIILVHFKFTHLPIYDEMEKLTFAGTVASVSECGCLVPLLSAA
jgi:hypothetical protein